MIFVNGSLALYVHPYWSSTIVHGIGFLFGFALYALFPFFKNKQTSSKQNGQATTPLSWWNFLGGVSGGLTVIFASITINSELSVSGSVALMLLGQILFALICDYFGFLGVIKRKPTLNTYVQIFLVLTGCLMILMSKI